MTMFCVWFLGYAYRCPSKGITINVREPNISFGKMNYSHQKSAIAPSLFFNFAWIHLSSFVVPFELCIHVAMGHDLSRIEDEGGAEACEGMMAQEMNHGKAQLLYSKAAEKDFNFPAGYRKLYKSMLMNSPSQLSLAIIAYLESSLVMYTTLLASNTWIFEFLYPDKKMQWLWAWHFMEETEHCWDSVEDALGRSNAPLLWMVCPITSLYFLVVFSTHCLVESVLYAPLQLLNPLALIPNLCTWIFGFTIVAPSMIVNNALRLLLRMKPSDDVYTKTSKSFRETIYLEICGDDMFKTTHVQIPHKNIKHRESQTFRGFPMTKRGSIRNSLVFGTTVTRNPQKDGRMGSFVNKSAGENIPLTALRNRRMWRA
mmetsp:Transcript_5524/g.8429  ORF Transcript_5524/g.8429 Transcript_5524/m.8429 type:complete len:371 (+) Transcript_5524:294-1406(+)